MKIRIGNDLRFTIKLNSPAIHQNMLSVKVYLINKTLKQKVDEELRKKTRFISRYPIEPMRDSYIATANNINGCGYPSYRAYPYKHWNTPYAGFGVQPRFEMIYPEMPEYSFIRYSAHVKATPDENKLEVIFPAHAQKNAGIYDIVIIAHLYTPGYLDNVRTVTLDYSNAFELVRTSEEADTDGEGTIEINPFEDEPVEPEIDVHVAEGAHDGDNTLLLVLNDGEVVDVDTEKVTGWYEEEP